jgi:hypothetical protein
MSAALVAPSERRGALSYNAAHLKRVGISMAKPRDLVEAELAQLGLSGTNGMIDELARTLLADERIIDGLSSESKDLGGQHFLTILVVTVRRAIAVQKWKGLFAGGDRAVARVIYWQDVSTVEVNPMWIDQQSFWGNPNMKSIKFKSYSKDHDLWVIFKASLDRGEFERFADVVNELVAHAKGADAPSSGVRLTDQFDGLTDQLERLAALHHDGRLTDDEFNAAKRRLLG